MTEVAKLSDVPSVLNDDYICFQDGFLYGFSNPFTENGKNVLCEDFHIVGKGHCRRCKKIMVPHQKFFLREDQDYDGALIVKWVYSFRTGYCPSCIEAERLKKRKAPLKIPVHELIKDKWDNITEEIVTYPNGEKIALSWSEK